MERDLTRSKIALQGRQPVTRVVKRVTTAQCVTVKPWQQFQKSSRLILETVFKLDTGAEANAVSTKTFESLKGIKLEKPVKVLCGPNGQSLKVVGQAAVQLTYKGKSCTQPIYVIDDLKSNLLGLPAITALQILVKVTRIQPGDIY